jgi:hypothetical protein
MVIHEQSMGGIGGVIGNAGLVNGASTHVLVTVNRDIIDGETLYAMLHTDDGAIGMYERPGGNVDGPSFQVIAPPFVVTR